MDYKDTLLLPKTGFPMRGNLPQNEPKRYQKWFEEKDVYQKMTTAHKGAKTFTLHDGPPYANGNIHIGHALNKILKDIVVKSHYFRGEDVRFTPGWDCHGLPIEQQVEKKLGEKKKSLPVTTIRRLCREHAQKFVDVQKEEFKSLGVVADWKNPYLTMKYPFEADIFRALCEIAQKGLLIERSKPVYWSWAAQTALAEAEVEYEEKEDYSIYVAFELDAAAKEKLGIDNGAVVIWTTTPWTLPANVGISLNPEEEYILTSDGYIVAKKRFDALREEEAIKGEIVKTIPAKALEHLYAVNPLNGRKSQIILGEHVMMDGGTGCVHTAPGHGEDDYRVGLKYNLDVIMPVDDRGLFDETVVREKLLPNPETFVGMHIFKSNELILELLGDALLKVSKFTHSYPFCWRTHKPVIYRATKQWFIAMDQEQNGKTLRETAMENIDGITFYPAASKNRLTSMVENRPDWCISRQRDWGVPIAFFRNKKTGEVILDEKVLNFLAMIFERQGTDVWWEMEIKELLYPGSGYNPDDLEKVNDILDVWFDSGSTWKAVLKSREYDAGEYPANMYLEGSDQHRGWFQSSLIVSSAINGISPFKNLVTHGFTNDAKGEKMSKSKGNVVAPDKVAKQYGTEIIRLWVALSDYQNDLKIGDDILKQIAEQYRKTRNTLRFLLANINDLETVLPTEELGELDRWILTKAKKVFDEADMHFQNYDFSKALSLLNHFITVELSGIHMDISKDRLYCNAKEDKARRSAQTAMALIAERMIAFLAPVLTYTVDEILEYAPAILKKDAEDVFDLLYTTLPEVESDLDEAFMTEAREKFFEIVDGLKKEKKIKATLELAIQTESERIGKLDPTDAEDWFTVSSVSADEPGEEIATFEVDGDTFVIVKSSKAKCPRCWKQKSTDEESLCERCAQVVG
ncbi:MAG: isoleucine--tRNA ligase [Sulfurospirillum sp.]|nr:MAG: isoleucine--tRNA ligase [Sulfurospirillum sp.]